MRIRSTASPSTPTFCVTIAERFAGKRLSTVYTEWVGLLSSLTEADMSEQIIATVKKIRRRLDLIRFLNLAVWSMTTCLAIGCLVVLADKVRPFGLQPWWALGGGALAGLCVAVIWSVAKRHAHLEAALELDRRCGLAERVSTLMSLDPALLSEPAGLALAHDVELTVTKLRPAEQFPIRLPRFGWAPILPAVAILAIAYLVSPFDLFGSSMAQAVTVEESKRVGDEAKLLEKKLDERRKEAKEANVPEKLKELTEDVSKATREISENKKISAKDAVLKLSDLAKSVEEKRKEMDSLDMMKRNLAKMPNTPEGPAKKLSQALKNGDFKEAAKQMEQLKKQIEQGKLNEKEQEKLAQQLTQLQKQLKEMADLQKRAEQLAKSLPKEQLKKELEKLKQDQKKMEQLQKLANQLAKCTECMGNKDGDGKGNKPGDAQSKSNELAKAMQDAQNMLEQLSKDEGAAKMLDEMLTDLSQCKNGMCEGMGDCDGKGEPDWSKIKHSDFAKGRGRADGKRGEKKDDTKSRETRVESQINKGPAFIAGQAEGNNFRGESKAQIREAASSAGRVADEAITRQKVPAEYKDHARDYFNRLNGELK